MALTVLYNLIAGTILELFFWAVCPWITAQNKTEFIPYKHNLSAAMKGLLPGIGRNFCGHTKGHLTLKWWSAAFKFILLRSDRSYPATIRGFLPWSSHIFFFWKVLPCKQPLVAKPDIIPDRLVLKKSPPNVYWRTVHNIYWPPYL